MSGQKAVCCFADVHNLPKAKERTPTKLTRIFVDSFMKRPSLSKKAADAIFEFANSGVLVEQTPQSSVNADASCVFILKNKYMFATVGKSVIYHLVDGKVKETFAPHTDPNESFLGNVRYCPPETSEPAVFEPGEHTFLICSKKLAERITNELLEEAFLQSIDPEWDDNKKNSKERINLKNWLEAIMNNYDNNYSPYIEEEEEVSAVAANLPPKKKKGKTALIIIITAIIALAIGFGAGFFTGAKSGAQKARDEFAQNAPEGMTPPQGPSQGPGQAPGMGN